jgi:hypothetical protein
VSALVSRVIWVLGSTQGVDFVTTGAAIMFFRSNTICGVAVEKLIGTFVGQFWIITHSGNFAIVHQFTILNVDLHLAANAKIQLEQSQTEHTV